MKIPTSLQNELRKAIHDLHGCDSHWLRSESVTEKYDGKIAWDGAIEVFQLFGHPTANLCYAWPHSIVASTKQKYVAVLHQPPVDSPQAAIRAAIVQEYREKHGEL